jgi:hypothetical protein
MANDRLDVSAEAKRLRFPSALYCACCMVLGRCSLSTFVWVAVQQDYGSTLNML